MDRMRRERIEKAKMACKKYGLEVALLLHNDNVRYVGGGDGIHMWHGVSGYRLCPIYCRRGQDDTLRGWHAEELHGVSAPLV